ncbi:MAG: substrate-binding domain-containing protein [Spirochaetales bacterium]|uniref:substrate-binding domain-containing protein n=1 Tax=Bullifex sp. TaxID=2815808 RepID=UPI002A543123|nr:substrate-binding domain-containing protein [Bullifex sp.]MDD5973191.1 substrate-binding domain-containing protein [Spirochaetales bacterium]MDD7270916.1 substrate-binding domain-containing protein [Spirochaetales bacterium]MDY4068179.1 substrate-binding domain-containing protein [Bullifex sp.]
MKKVIVFVLVAALALTAVFAQGASESSSKSYTIHLITMDQMDQHWVACNQGAQDAGKELGVKVVFNSPDTKDDNKQIECINNSVAQGADAILVAANAPDSQVSALKEAAAAGVKIVYVDSPANFESLRLFATDNEAGGKKIGEALLAELNKKGITSGKIGVIGVNPATESCNSREKGFRSAFVGTNFTLLETQYCDGDATRSKEAADNFIAQGCVAVYGSNEGSTVGAGNAVKEAKAAGIDVIGCGSDASDTNKSLVKEGALLCIMGQNPYQMGYQGVKAAVDILNGVDMGGYKYIDTGVNVITAANVDQF